MHQLHEKSVLVYHLWRKSSSNLFNNHPTPPRMSLYTLGKLSELLNQRREIVDRETIRIMNCRSTIKWRSNIIMSPFHSSPSSSSSCHPLLPIENPIIIPPISYLCRSHSPLNFSLSEMQTIVVMGERLGIFGAFGRLNISWRKVVEGQKLQELWENKK